MSLRTCGTCGKDAKTVEDLDLFDKAKKYKHGRRNTCKECSAASTRKGGKYHESHKTSTKRWEEKNKEKLKTKSMNRYCFKGKTITLDINPRTNVCSQCGGKYPEKLNRQTSLHHTIYDEENPLDNVVELCQPCHLALHHQRGDMK